MSTTINTSKSKEVTVNISDYDNIPLSFKIYDKSVDPKVVIDLTDYKFSFLLKQDTYAKGSYVIEAAEMTTDFLSKSGSSNEILNMQEMWEDIRTKCLIETKYRLIMVVTRPDGTIYTYTVFKINASKH